MCVSRFIANLLANFLKYSWCIVSCRDSNRHVKVKQKSAVLNMLKKLDKIRFRGHKRDEFLDLAESPNASDTECGDEIPVKIPRTSTRDNEELRDPVST